MRGVLFVWYVSPFFLPHPPIRMLGADLDSWGSFFFFLSFFFLFGACCRITDFLSSVRKKIGMQR